MAHLRANPGLTRRSNVDGRQVGKISHAVRRLALVAAATVMIGVLVYLAIGSYIALKLTAPDPATARGTPADYSLAYDSPTIKTADGVALASWFIPRAGSDRVVLMLHGLWNCRSCEFDGRFLEMASHWNELGYNVMMLDMRTHGESQGDHFTFGQKERWDVLAAVGWLQQRGFSKIGIHGVSLGAESSIIAAADAAGGGGRIRALVLDSPFARCRPTIDRSFTFETGLPAQLLPGAVLMMRLLLGVDFDAINPVEEMPKITVPVMLIYGRQDKYLSAEQMEEMAKSRPDAEVWFSSDAGHARIYNAHEQEYVSKVSRFMDRALE